MKVIDILELCKSSGLKVEANGDKLKVLSKGKTVSDEIKALLKNNKKELIAFLSEVNSDLKVDKIAKVSKADRYPLSFAQQRLWFLNEYMGANALYNMPLALRIVGEVDESALIASLKTIYDRHDALRTRLEIYQENAYQVIDTHHLDINVEQVSSKFELEQVCQCERFHEFDLAKEQLCRIRLINDASDLNSSQADEKKSSSYVLLVTMHHSISDGWSLGVFFRELVALYDTYHRGEKPQLPDLPIQYVDYAHWQRNYLQGDVLQKQLSFWKQQLADLPPLLNLPIDRPRPSEQTFYGSTESIKFPPRLFQELKKLSQSRGATLFMTLLSAFAILLSRYSGQDDIAVGTPIANRTRPETEGLIGFFINTLVLRNNLAGDPSFYDLLERTREMALQAYAHQDIPFEQLVQTLSPERNVSHSPLFQVMFNIQSISQQQMQPSKKETSAMVFEELSFDGDKNGVSRFDLSINLVEDDTNIEGKIEFNTGLFEQATIKRLIQHYLNLLSLIVEKPEQKISQLDFLDGQETKLLKYLWNDTQANFDDDRCLHELFEQQVDKNAHSIALIDYSNDNRISSVSYAELNQRANLIAQLLRSKGVVTESRVAICLDRGIDALVAMLGVLKAGASYVPIEPDYPLERINFILDDSNVKLIISHSNYKKQLGHKDTHLVFIEQIDFSGLSQKFSNENIKRNSLTSRNICHIIYTSGSTGVPKGVMTSHLSVVNRIEWFNSNFETEDGDVHCQKTNFGFVDHVAEIFQALSVGKLLLVIQKETLQSAKSLLDLLRDFYVSQITLVPSLLKVIVEDKELKPLVNMKRVFSSGEALQLNSMESFYQLFPNAILHNVYGSTEVAADVCVYKIESDAKEASPNIGKPISNMNTYILNRELQLLPAGSVGELYVGGIGLSRGYNANALLTAESFVPNPFSKLPGQRLYRTGDLARFEKNGNIIYVGRIDQQVKVRGFRIEVSEIEASLLNNETVKEAIVVARKFQDDMRLVAYVTQHENCADDDKDSKRKSIQSLRDSIQSKLPGYMIPSAIEILDSMPLNVNGKVDKNRLPNPDLSLLRVEYIPPENDLEIALAGIWSSVLSCSDIGRLDNFFELGGHSLLATQLVSRIRKTFSIELTVHDLFENQSLQSQAILIKQAKDKYQTQQNSSFVRFQKNKDLLNNNKEHLVEGEI